MQDGLESVSLTEEEWEHAFQQTPIKGNFAERGYYQPIGEIMIEETSQSFSKGFGDVWEWTQSSISL